MKELQIGIISDVHGNFYALEVVLGELRKKGVDEIVFLGDIGFMGLFPQECLTLLDSVHPLVSIKGNTDANVEDYEAFVPGNEFERQLVLMCRYMDEHMDQLSKERLRDRSIAERHRVGKSDIIFCHGSPYSYRDQFTAACKSEYTERIEQEQVALVCCGHTHQPCDFHIGQTRIINPGAVGYSLNGDTRAHYGIMRWGKDGAECSVSFETVDYPRTRYMADVRKAQPPFEEMLLHLLEYGQPME